MSTLSASSPVCPQRVASLRLALEQWDARQARTSKSASGVPQPADMIAKMGQSHLTAMRCSGKHGGVLMAEFSSTH
jgi:hypothetical protein